MTAAELQGALRTACAGETLAVCGIELRRFCGLRRTMTRFSLRDYLDTKTKTIAIIEMSEELNAAAELLKEIAKLRKESDPQKNARPTKRSSRMDTKSAGSKATTAA